jgi:hypothetical protein
LRGASAMQKLLEQYPAAAVRVFAVWEPVRFADWQRPTTAALGRVSDPRVTQYWDHDHVLANKMAAENQPNCCQAKNILFDLVAVYPPGSTWSEHLPHPDVFDGPIFRMIPNIQALLSSH